MYTDCNLKKKKKEDNWTIYNFFIRNNLNCVFIAFHLPSTPLAIRKSTQSYIFPTYASRLYTPLARSIKMHEHCVPIHTYRRRRRLWLSFFLFFTPNREKLKRATQGWESASTREREHEAGTTKAQRVRAQ